jgi:hypothetical protein
MRFIVNKKSMKRAFFDRIFDGIALEKSSMYALFDKYSVVVVRLTPSLPQRGRHPKGNPPDPRVVRNFQLTSLPSEGPTMRPSDPQKGGEILAKFKRPHL